MLTFKNQPLFINPQLSTINHLNYQLYDLLPVVFALHLVEADHGEDQVPGVVFNVFKVAKPELSWPSSLST